MIKTFRLTIDFKAEIKDYIQGVKNKKVEEFTREIARCFLSDDRILVEFIKLLFYSRYLQCSDPEAGFGKTLGLKTEKEILIDFLPKVSPETAFYLKTICCPEYMDFEYEGEGGTAYDFVLKHFSCFHFINCTLTGIDDAANKENDFLVMEGAEIAGSTHAQAQVKKR